MTGGPQPWFPLRAAAVSPSRVASRMFSRSVSDHRGEEREQDATGAGGVVDPGQRSGEHLQSDAVRGDVVGQRGQLGGVAAQPFHLVDGEDDPAVWGVGLDLPYGFQGGLELRADSHAAGDPFSAKIFSRAFGLAFPRGDGLVE